MSVQTSLSEAVVTSNRNQTIQGTKTFTNTIAGSIFGATGTFSSSVQAGVGTNGFVMLQNGSANNPGFLAMFTADGTRRCYLGWQIDTNDINFQLENSWGLQINSPTRFNINNPVGIRAAASGSAATQIPVFTADPSSTTRTLVTRTPQQIIADSSLITSGQKNKIDNGKMELVQRPIPLTVASGTGFPVDRWRMFNTSNGTITGTRNSSPGDAGVVSKGFNYYLRLQTTVGDSSLTTTQYILVGQTIEGINVQDLVNNDMTLSFWVRTNLAGTYSVVFRNGDPALNSFSASYVVPYTVNTASAWQFVTITVPGGINTSVGTSDWYFDWRGGLTIFFSLGAGPTFSTSTYNQWVNGNFISSANNINWASAANRTFDLTGVQLERSSVATSFQHRHLQQEWAICQRYYQRRGGNTTLAGIASTGSAMVTTTLLPVVMRKAPTIGYSSFISSQATTNDYFVTTGGVADRYFLKSLTTTPAAGSLGAFSFAYNDLSFDAEFV